MKTLDNEAILFATTVMSVYHLTLWSSGMFTRVEDQPHDYVQMDDEFMHDSASAHFQIGFEFQQHGYLDDAVSFYKRAEDIYPMQKDVHNNLAVLYMNSYRLVEAKSVWEKGISLFPDNDLLKSTGELIEQRLHRDSKPASKRKKGEKRGFSDTRRKLTEGAVDSFREGTGDSGELGAFVGAIPGIPLDASETISTGKTLWNFAFKHQQAGILVPAEIAYRELIWREPTYHPHLYNNLALLLGATGRIDEARSLWHHGLLMWPDNKLLLENGEIVPYLNVGAQPIT